MIKNGDFEQDWSDEESHRCYVFDADNERSERDVGNIFTPPGWITWFKHVPGTWDQPEVRDAWAQGDARRVHTGQKAMLLFTFYRRHDAGFLQQVQTQEGQRLSVSAWAHAWSNGLEAAQGGRLDDPYWSDGVGKQIIAIATRDVPELNGDPQNDAIGNFLFAVGIDPTGGVNPYASSVVWGEPFAIYNGYVQPLTVEATAAGDTATIFLRSITAWQFKHNDAYWDTVTLEVSDEEPEPDERGKPRVQYARTYVLLPPDAGSEWANAVIDATWDDRRYTVGGSADDAGIGDLDERNVIAVNPDGWGDLGAFFDEHYSGVNYTPVVAANPDDLRRVLSGQPPDDDILLGQRDEAWGSVRYNGGRCQTIAAQGCWLACCAMARRWFGIDPLSTPDEVDAALSPGDYSECSMTWAAMPKIGLEVELSTTNDSLAAAHVGAGGVAFVDVTFGTGKHFVMGVRYDDGRWWMYDPLKRVVGWLDDYYSGVDSYRLISATELPTLDHPIGGLHDMAGADWMLANGVKGWCCVPMYLGTSAQARDWRAYHNAGINVVGNLRYSYAVDDGGAGTMPGPGQLPAFEAAAIETMRQSQGAWGWAYCNEMNNVREHPDGYPLTWQYYADSYNRVRSAKPGEARLSPGAIDPFNPGWGDWRDTWTAALNRMDGADFLALHAYDHGKDADRDMVFGDDPLKSVFYNLRVLESQREALPTRYRGLTIVITETNHLYKDDGSIGWEDDGYWSNKALNYFRSQGVAGACLFRYNYDQWRVDDKQNVLDVLR